jgi:hypothetical protein
MNPEFKPLADALYKERVLRARRTPPEQRIMEGPALFDMACAATMAGIRMQMPGATEEQVLGELRRRLEVQRRLENRRA